ncbi:non-ribosomal peptide synthetase/type I polyketide synthase [Paenibacillus arenosi]|uniref:Amino acid adenylation domain-containing protein n=1 Tax=Paenibacillus arenosi TaxID=2774142 RepID=A0ABR9ATB3_9BACL|nr:non-ribosomal peptide synthetase/type I polyketide synthase [Paenibacillus arenosi]MBD8496924.1 amino acid adenylation domain-containing protein [Paenibacillus arenosi]
MSHTNGLEIAVIGMACRFPGARNIDEYWHNLSNGVESISFFTEEELKEAGVDPELLRNPNYVKAKGYIEDIEYFDAAFFQFSAREAEIMDPQIRVLQECAWEALEHSGYTPHRYEGDIGLYAGASTNFNWEPLASYTDSSLSSEGFEAGTLAFKDALSTLISYKLNLRGPSLSLYSACSTSLSSIHQACRGLLLGECSIALAGGVSVSYPKKHGYLYQEGMIESPDGHCRSFDAKAEGSVFGDGAGIVVLKRLEDAIADGDTIHAVVKASAMNNDGSRKVGYTAPSVEGQAEVVRKALHLAEVEHESITYIEAHGSGTSMGDPIEIKALEKAYDITGKRVCAVGSVKSNVGHLDTASGVAGFIKTVLALKNKQIPPSLHFETPNPEIHFEVSPFYVNDRLADWKSSKYPLRAGVSSFGLGGTNIHVIIEEAPAMEATRPAGRSDKLLVLSARSEAALDQAASNLAAFLEHQSEIDIEDAAYTLQVGRDVYPYRRTVVCNSVEEAIASLKPRQDSQLKATYTKETVKQTVFMFSGQSAQYVQMGRGLYDTQPVFRQAMNDCFDLYRSLTGTVLKEILYPDSTLGAISPEEAQQRIQRTEISQPVLFVFEYSLAKLLMSWGIRPDAVIGYSFGEYAAACIAGVFSLKDALSLVVQRGKLMQSLPKGAMLSVPLAEKELLPLLEEGVSIAVVNDPSCIVSGSEEAIERFEQQMKQRKLLCMRLNSNHAAHSKWMEPVMDALECSLQPIRYGQAQVKYVSGMKGKAAQSEEIANHGYWVRQLAEPVRFSDGIAELCTHPSYVFIEVGPGRELSTMIRRHMDGTAHRVVDLIQPFGGKMSADRYLLRQLGKLWANGVAIDWKQYHDGDSRMRIPLPTYPFEKKYFWPDVKQTKRRQEKKQKSIHTRKSSTPEDWFYFPIWKQSALKYGNRTTTGTGSCNVVFMDEYGVGAELAEILRQAGSDVVQVWSGHAFKTVNSNEFILNLGDLEDYLRLFSMLKQSERTPNRIIHACSLCKQSDVQQWEALQVNGYYSLLHVAKAAAEIFVSTNLQLDVIANNIHEVSGNELLYPAHSTMLGPCKVIPQEYAEIRSRMIDIDIEELISSTKVIGQIATEVNMVDAEPVVSLRNGKRWVPCHEQVRLDRTGEDDTILRDEGVYVITGGTGGIALELAVYLARTKKANLALIHRSSFPERNTWEEWLDAHEPNDPTSIKIRKLLEVERHASGLMLERADVSNMEQMQTAVSRIEQKFRQIHGIIHAAGTLTSEAFSAVTDTGKEESESQFTAKIYGSLVLDKLFQGKSLDFCLLMSSISSVLGGLGHVAYCAANSFLDAYAFYQNRGEGKRWLSVNWDGWLVMKIEDGAWDEIWKETAMTPAEGVDAFERVLACISASQIVNSTADLQSRIDAWSSPKASSRSEEQEQSFKLTERPEMSVLYEVPRNETEQAIAKIFQHIVRIHEIGIHDDFLELGGDSLKAITVLSNIRQQFNTDIPLKQFFNNLTVERLAALILNKSDQDLIGKDEARVVPAAKQELYPLSTAQKRMYLLDQLNTGSTLYNTTILKKVGRSVSKQKLEQIFKALIERHESLRTSFMLQEDVPYQKVHDSVDFQLSSWNLSSAPDQAAQVMASFVEPFDLSHAPLLRVGYIDVGGDKNIVIIDIHHIITDLISMDVVQRDFSLLLEGIEPEPVTLQYKDYAVWQNSNSYKKRLQQQESYWLSKFSSKPPLLNLPTDYPRSKTKTYAGSNFCFEFNAEETRLLRQLGKANDSTIFMLLLTAFKALLFRLTGQMDMVVGVPVAGRNEKELEHILGLFVNTLPIRSELCGSKTFPQWLETIKTNVLEAFEHQDYPFEELVERIIVERDTSRNPLFDVMFNLLDRREDEELDEDYRTDQFYNLGCTSKFDLSMTVREAKHKLYVEIEYSTELFNESTIRAISSYYQHLLHAVVHNETIPINEVELVPEQMLRDLYDRRNCTALPYPAHATVCGLIDEQAFKYPDRAALICDGRELTYEEMRIQSNQLAHTLQLKGISQGSLVGLLLDHSIEAVIAILAVMKSGASYLPIDPEYPQERIRFLLEDSRTDLLLVSGRTLHTIDTDCRVLNVEDSQLYSHSATSLQAGATAVDTAYVIYTSGSTGLPKGVAISHQSLLNYINWAIHVYMDKEGAFSFPLYSSLSFDLTVTSLFAPLATGHPLIIYKDNEGNKEMVIQRMLEDDAVHVIKVTPTHLKLIKELGIQASNVRTFIVGGEALSTVLARDIYRLFDGKVAIYNEYGPTEATVGCMIHKFDVERDERLSVPIGNPAGNAKIYVLDSQLHLVPAAIPGEIYISGDGIAKHYLYRPELTQERFLPDPFEPGRVMYKTGDLARLLPDGSMEYLGRLDHQVKIRGFRIELDEITHALEAHPSVKEGIVVARESGSGEADDRYLCAYYVPLQREDDLTLLNHELKQDLARKLPAYLVPQVFVNVETLPVTPNGKLDLDRLPAPIRTGEQHFAAVETALEQKLLDIWAEVLKRDANQISIDANFFELGGHSLKATVVASRLHKALQVKVPLIEFINRPTIRELASYVQEASSEAYAPIPRAADQPYYELAPAQRKLYFLQQLNPNDISYNMPMFWELQGSLEQDKLKAAFHKLVYRHESLRTSFILVDGQPFQQLNDSSMLEIECENVSYYREPQVVAERMMSEFIRPFDLSTSPLRIGLIQTSEQRHILMVDIHHIVTDGVSMEILARDFMALYAGEQLPDLKVRYRDYTEWYRQLCAPERMEKQAAYWQEQFQGELPVLHLPVDYDRPSIRSFEGGYVEFKLASDKTEQLKQLALQEGATLYLILLSAFNVLLAKLSGQEDIIIGTDTAGRGHDDIQQLIGNFANTLALRNYPVSSLSFYEFLADVKGRLLEAYEHQDFQFEDVVEMVVHKRDLSRHPLFDVMFGFLGHEGKELEMSGLMLRSCSPEKRTAIFDLVLLSYQQGESLVFELEFSTKLFKRSTVDMFVRSFIQIVDHIIAQPNCKLADIRISHGLQATSVGKLMDLEGDFRF